MTAVNRVRFAPSPTGNLHIGNARTALLNWLFACNTSSKLILRIEDTDRERTLQKFEQNIIYDLKWLGIEWDEGPDKDGKFGPYNQFSRLNFYDLYLKKLINLNKVYKCYCTEEELFLEKKRLLSQGLIPKYNGKCREYSQKKCRELENSGIKPSYRFKVGEGIIEFVDLIKGKMKFDCKSIGDFIIVRSNGIPAYNFAVVIDDYLMQITHVIRGEDHLSNTALQIMIYNMLNLTIPQFAHHSLILTKNRTKFSKREKDISIKEFRKNGFLPEAIINYLSLLGNSFIEGNEILSVNSIKKFFSLDRISKSSAIFDHKKLEWINKQHIMKYKPKSLMILAEPFLKSQGYELNNINHEWLVSLINLIQKDIKKISDIGNAIEFFFDNRFHIHPDAFNILKTSEVKIILEIMISFLLAITIYDNHNCTLYACLIETIKKKIPFNMEMRKIFMSIRVIVTGRTKGPELDKIFALLTYDSLLKRTKIIKNLINLN